MKYPSGYGIVFKKVLCDPTISREAKAVYALLAAYTGNDDVCWPSMKTIAECLGCSEQSARNWLGELSERGWVEIEHSTGRHSNKYRLVIPSTGVEGSTEKKEQPPTGVEGKPPTGVDPTINTLTNNNENTLQFAADLPPHKPPVKRKKDKPINPLAKEAREITDYYQELYLEEHKGTEFEGIKPPWDGKIMKLVYADLHRFGVEVLGDLVHDFFEYKPGFVTKNETGLGYNVFHSLTDGLLERKRRRTG